MNTTGAAELRSCGVAESPPVGRVSRPDAVPSAVPPLLKGEGAGGEAPSAVLPNSAEREASRAADLLSALKGDLINLLWPTGGYRAGSLYGFQARQPARKAKLDRRLRTVLEHFGHARVLELAAELNASMTAEAGRPPRTFLGHLDILEQLQLQDEQAGPTADDVACHNVGQKIAAQAEVARTAAEAAGRRFDRLPASDRGALIDRARRSNPVLRNRAHDSPILRAAAIALMPDVGTVDVAQASSPAPAGPSSATPQLRNSATPEAPHA